MSDLRSPGLCLPDVPMPASLKLATIVTLQSNFRKRHSSKIPQISRSLIRGVNSLSWLIIRTKKGLNV